MPVEREDHRVAGRARARPVEEEDFREIPLVVVEREQVRRQLDLLADVRLADVAVGTVVVLLTRLRLRLRGRARRRVRRRGWRRCRPPVSASLSWAPRAASRATPARPGTDPARDRLARRVRNGSSDAALAVRAAPTMHPNTTRAAAVRPTRVIAAGASSTRRSRGRRRSHPYRSRRPSGEAPSSVAESPFVVDPLIWNLVPSISLRICLIPPLASPSSICLASMPW